MKTPFGKGAALPILLVAALELSGGLGVFFRRPKDIIRVENFIQNAPANISTMEIPRMKKVMRNFIIYRNVEIVLITVSVIPMFGTSGYDFWKGVGTGLLIQTTLVLCLDFFAEWRGHIYMDYLVKFAEKT